MFFTTEQLSILQASYLIEQQKQSKRQEELPCPRPFTPIIVFPKTAEKAAAVSQQALSKKQEDEKEDSLTHQLKAFPITNQLYQGILQQLPYNKEEIEFGLRVADFGKLTKNPLGKEVLKAYNKLDKDLQERYKTAIEIIAARKYWPRNIYILPIEKTRVKVDRCFINANYVLNGTAIVSDSPQPADITSFWSIAFKANVSTIVTLNELSSRIDKSQPRYWPQIENEKIERIKIEGGKMQVEVDKPALETVINGIVIRTFKLTSGGTLKKVTQLQCAIPDGSFLSPVQMIEIYRLVNFLWKPSENRLLAHCLAGFGRSGTFIANVKAFKEIDEGRLPNIPAIINELREARDNLVSNKNQYLSIFENSLIYRLKLMVKN